MATQEQKDLAQAEAVGEIVRLRDRLSRLQNRKEELLAQYRAAIADIENKIENVRDKIMDAREARQAANAIEVDGVLDPSLPQPSVTPAPPTG